MVNLYLISECQYTFDESGCFFCQYLRKGPFVQCLSNFSLCQKHRQDLLWQTDARTWGGQGGRCCGAESTFLKSPQMLPLLLVQAPHSDNHYISGGSETKLQTTKPHTSKVRDVNLYLKEQIQSHVGNKLSLSETHPLTPHSFPVSSLKNKTN